MLFERLRLPPVALAPVIATVALDVLMLPAEPAASVIEPAFTEFAVEEPLILPPARAIKVLALSLILLPRDTSLGD